jgi:DNA repair protein RadC
MADASRCGMPTLRRYRRREIRYTVVRDAAQDAYREIGCPQAAAALAAELVARHDDDREHFWVIFLNARNHYQGHHEVAMGGLTACMVEPREVLGPGLREGAAHLIVVHNHPSSDPTPSGEDIRLTATLAEGATLLGLRLHDHVIVGNGSLTWVSLAERGLV